MNIKSVCCLCFILLAVYLVTVFFVLKFKKTDRLKFDSFPRLKMKKDGVVFCSYKTHRIKIVNTKVWQIQNVVYLKTRDKLVLIFNVDNAKILNNFLYFTCHGQVKILFNSKNIFRYFALRIESKLFNLNDLKNNAVVDILNNGFDVKFSKVAQKYIKIIENVLKIGVFNEKITICQNKYRLAFTLIYKSNNRIKKINVNQTL